jgi:hypothetical protein
MGRGITKGAGNVVGTGLLLVLLGCGTPVESPPTDSAGRSPTRTPFPDISSAAREWVNARNAGDIDRALSYIADRASILGIVIVTPSDRDRLRAVLEAQRIAAWTIEESACTQPTAELLVCRYAQHDRILDRWGLVLIGTHTYHIRNGKIFGLDRAHDSDSRSAVYAAAAAFHSWVEDHHPQEAKVIWIDPRSALYTTPAGARAALSLLDEYEDARR